jgi:hypothetical protein
VVVSRVDCRGASGEGNATPKVVCRRCGRRRVVACFYIVTFDCISYLLLYNVIVQINCALFLTFIGKSKSIPPLFHKQHVKDFS